MHNLALPSVSGTEAFTAVVSTIRSTSKRQRYLNAEPIIAECCKKYDDLASKSMFENATSASFAVQEIEEDDMVSLYDQQFVKNQGAQHIRDSVTNSSPNGLCPYCGQGSVYELDHYLPKRPFTGIAVYPANLVPACRDCNRVKSGFRPTAKASAVLHPYFDEAFQFRWLYAAIVRQPDGKPGADFLVRVEDSRASLRSRIDSHMEVFHLYDRYRVLASQSLNDFEMLMKSPHGYGMNLEHAKRHLMITAYQQSGGRKNSWELALYEAMANDEWYLTKYLNVV